MLVRISASDLSNILREAIDLVSLHDQYGSALLETLYRTGLRAGEVVDVNRWQAQAGGGWEVQLSKREKVRTITTEQVSPVLVPYYLYQQELIFHQYSSLNRLFQRAAPVLYFENLNEKTTLHAFRYNYLLQLQAQGLSLAEIAAGIGHINSANTARYLAARIFVIR